MNASPRKVFVRVYGILISIWVWECFCGFSLSLLLFLSLSFSLSLIGKREKKSERGREIYKERERRGELFVHLFMVSFSSMISLPPHQSHTLLFIKRIIPHGVVNRFACENIIAVTIFQNACLKFGTKLKLPIYTFTISMVKNPRGKVFLKLLDFENRLIILSKIFDFNSIVFH